MAGAGGGDGGWGALLGRCEARARAAAERLRAERAPGAPAAGGGGLPATLAVAREAASGLSVAEMRARYVDRGLPVVITGLGSALAGLPEGCDDVWALLRSRFGHKTQMVFRQPGDDEEGGKDNTLGESELMRVGDLLDLMSRAPAASGAPARVYMYDTPLASKLPELLEHWRVPRYFAHCLLQKTRLPHPYLRSWPTAFVGSAGTASTVHVDRWHSHFWMVQVSGAKRWTIWPEEDTPLLRPSWARGTYDPQFPPFGDLVGDPDVALTRPAEVVVEAGEVLFMPGGCPHRVQNLEDSVSFAGNFVDSSNVEAVLADQLALGRRYPEALELHAALAEVDWSDEWKGPEEALPPEQMAVDYFQDFANRAFS